MVEENDCSWYGDSELMGMMAFLMELVNLEARQGDVLLALGFDGISGKLLVLAWVGCLVWSSSPCRAWCCSSLWTRAAANPGGGVGKYLGLNSWRLSGEILVFFWGRRGLKVAGKLLLFIELTLSLLGGLMNFFLSFISTEKAFSCKM